MTQLKKGLGLWSAISIVIGSVIGSGIFMKPATMAAQLGSPYLLIVVWIVAGIISLFGGMVFAELGSMFPQTGGQYVYLRKTFGEFVAFLYGWSTIAVINSAGIASVAFVFADYSGYFFHLPRFAPAMEHAVRLHIFFVGDIFPLENFGTKMLAISIIGLLTLVNYISVRSGNVVQFIATLVKTIALVFLIFGILFSGAGSAKNLFTNVPSFNLSGWSLFAAFMAATSGAFASYDGWVNVNMVAGEIKDPKKNLSKSLVIGILACIAIYVLINLAYMYVLPISKMATSPLVASAATEKVMGVMGGGFIAVLIILSTFGSTNVNLLTNARIVFAMGRDRSFFTGAGKVHPRFHTPGNSVIIMGVWASFFIISGSFDALADMYIFTSWLFYGLTAVSIFVLRKKMPAADRPYKVKPYPMIPVLFVVFTLFYLGTTLYNDISNYNKGLVPVINSVFGLLLTAVGIPFYWYFKRQKPLAQKEDPNDDNPDDDPNDKSRHDEQTGWSF